MPDFPGWKPAPRAVPPPDVIRQIVLLPEGITASCGRVGDDQQCRRSALYSVGVHLKCPFAASSHCWASQFS
jgi:hypothetical protein